jgi:hypothetical protein
MRRCAVAVLLAVTLVSACDLVTVSAPSADRRVVGIIVWQSSTTADRSFDGPAVVIAAPDTVTAGTPFDATITTVGISGCWRQDGAQTTYDSGLAVVTPYDLVMTKIDGAPVACTDVLVQLPRTVRLVFGETGVALLRVSGRQVTGGELSSATPATVEKEVVVR